jgi:hypothetical protein
MSDQPKKEDPEPDLREIGAWSRRYAQNRTVPAAVSLLMVTIVMGVIMGISYLVDWAFMAGHQAWAPLAVVLLVLALALQASLLSRRSWCFIQRISDRVYRAEGTATVSAPETISGPRRRAHSLVVLGFVACIVAMVGLGLAGKLPLHYMQPISALYFVPFLLWLGFLLRESSPFMYLWPALYGLHAVLLVLGAPIYFSGSLESLNILVPMIGYGLVAGLAGHIYSRYALRKLRRLAAVTAEEGE